MLIAGGGTGGHLTPALALAQALRDADPGGSVMVVGRRDGVAERLVTEAGLPLETLAISGVDASSPRSVARALTQLPLATLAARRLVRRLEPDVVVGAGGYVCVPVVMAASAQHVPVVLLEQNAYPGRATRLLAKRAVCLAASFAETARLLPGVRVVHTGNPIRAEVRALVPAPLGEACKHVLVTGGSQGARRINNAVIGCIASLLQRNSDLRVTHQCGTLDWDVVRRAAAALPDDVRSRYEAAPFFDDIGPRIAASDVVVMRAGGSSLAECSALGRPMILVPYPHAGGHQRHNAVPYVRDGAAIMVDDAMCTPERLQVEVEALVRDTTRWRSMAEASARCGRPDAAQRVAELVGDAARSRDGVAA
ncbi:MAG: undecaprenyldiphospho-muramoylpentapeptide beta-N-acetylglucosaminyltransferase [Candidatus Dormibacteraeota bacterium]|nr:undecaprenyldiphospho-muramoylpentapeptide beta-N-acetylglucosaminyltransferase [Candidatus Dormibacteraeota bacterium]